MEETGTQKQEQFRKKCFTESGISYSVAAVLSVLLGYLASMIAFAVAGADYSKTDGYIYVAYLLSQIAFAGAAAIYFIRSKEPVRAPFAAAHPKYFIIALLLQFGLLFSLSELNTLFVSLWEKVGYNSGGVTVPDLKGWSLLPAILVIALLPALFEELLFRGILSRKLHDAGWGLLPTVLVSGALFALFHGRPEQTVYQFLCGCCFALIAIRAGSILPSMVAHFVNNTLVLTLTSFGLDNFSSLPLGGYLALILTSALCLLGVLVYLVFLDKRGNRKGGAKGGLLFFVAAGGGILICAAEWISVLVMGFLNG